ncbi:MAG: hypothetical protein K2N55_02155, partial [Lachnospiraceae bacterium]|nr:hypothetical protein [Lachnospiraceae bacterium]
SGGKGRRLNVTISMRKEIVRRFLEGIPEGTPEGTPEGAYLEYDIKTIRIGVKHGNWFSGRKEYIYITDDP